MEIVTTKSLLSTPEVAESLKREFSSHYSCTLLLEDNSIFVEKSTSVGVNIFIHENQIFVQGSSQAASQSLIETVLTNLCMSELGLFLIPLFYHKGTQLLSQRAEFEKEISYFLEHTYNHQNLGSHRSKANSA